MKTRLLTISIICCLILATGCSGQNSLKKTTSFPETLGEREGKLNLIAPSGYVEDGSTQSSVDWVSEFERSTKCKINLTTENDPDKLIEKMATGNYDGTVGTAQVSGALIKSKDVAPVNTNLISEYGNITSLVTNKSWNSADNQVYGIPISIGEDLLVYNENEVKSPPDSLGVLFDKKSKYKNKISVRDWPFSIAQAAMYLQATKPDLKIKSPFALDSTQFEEVKKLVEIQDQNVNQYWNNTLDVQNIFTKKAVVGILSNAYAISISSQNIPLKTVLPKEGAIGWSDSWMVSSRAKHPNCMYDWLNHITSPKISAAFAEYMGLAPANRAACDFTVDPNHCEIFHAKDTSYLAKLVFITMPTSKCLDDRENVKCASYKDWQQLWTDK